MFILSDIHLREETAAIVFGEVFPGIRKAMWDAKETHLAILGDVFHIRYSVSVDLLNRLTDFLADITLKDSVRVSILPGNHDQINVEGRNALEVLSHINGVIVHNEPVREGLAVWFPYRKPARVEYFMASVFGDRIPIKRPDVLFIHHGIKGAWMNDGYQDPDGLDPKIFKGFKKIICGHYHKPQELGDLIVYVGSPYQIDAGEAGQPKGYGIWDGKKYEFVPMRWGPRYHLIDLKEGEHFDIADIDSRDEVRVTTANQKQAEEIGKLLAGPMHVRKHTVTPRVETNEARLQPANESISSYAMAYLNALASPDMDREKLAQLFQEITA